MKKLPLITLVSFFILIPNINAETDGTYQIIRSNKYHYYFFSEPYDSRNAVNDLKTYEGKIIQDSQIIENGKYQHQCQ